MDRTRPLRPLDRWPQYRRPARARRALPPSRRVAQRHHRPAVRVWRLPRPHTLLPRRLLQAYLRFRHW